MRNGLVAVGEMTVHSLRAKFEGTPLTADQAETKVLVVLCEDVGGDVGAAVKFMKEGGVERAVFYRKTGIVLESVVEEKVSVRRVNEKAKVKAPRKARAKRTVVVATEPPVAYEAQYPNNVLESTVEEGGAK